MWLAGSYYPRTNLLGELLFLEPLGRTMTPRPKMNKRQLLYVAGVEPCKENLVSIKVKYFFVLFKDFFSTH